MRLLHPSNAPAPIVVTALEPKSIRVISGRLAKALAASGSAIKLCWVAEGSADVYPRFGPVREWDVAAGDAIVSAAGGIVTTPAGERLRYGQASAGFLVPGFIAWGDTEGAKKLAKS